MMDQAEQSKIDAFESIGKNNPYSSAAVASATPKASASLIV